MVHTIDHKISYLYYSWQSPGHTGPKFVDISLAALFREHSRSEFPVSSVATFFNEIFEKYSRETYFSRGIVAPVIDMSGLEKTTALIPETDRTKQSFPDARLKDYAILRIIK